MTLLRNGLIRFLFIIILVICAVLIIINVYLNIQIRKYVPAYLDTFSQSSGLTLELNEAGLDPFFRIKLHGVKAADRSGAQKGLAEIETLTIDPLVFSSLISRSIKLGEITIERPVIRYDRDSVNRLINRIEGEKEGGKASPVEVERIVLRDARFELSPGVSFTSKAMVILVSRGSSPDASKINIGGDIAVLENDMAIEGTINLLPGETSGKIKIATDKIKAGALAQSIISAQNIKGVSQLTFRIAENIEAEGELTVRADDKGSDALKDPLGRLNYKLGYDKKGDTAHISAIDFDIMDVLKGGLTGNVKDVTGDLVFDLSGSAATGDLKQLSARIPYISGEKLTGNIKSGNLKIGGSLKKGDLGLTGNIELDSISFAYKDDSLKISGLGCGMNVKQDLSGKGGFLFLSQGSCSAEKLSQKDIGDLDTISSGIEIEARDGWKAKEITLSDMSGKFMDGNVSGSLHLTEKDGESEVRGTIRGENLDLKKAPKSVAPFDMEGNAQSAAADITGNQGNYRAGISFVANDFLLRSKTGSEFKVSKAMTNGPLGFEYRVNAADEGNGDSVKESGRKIIVKDKGLSYENLSFGEYSIKAGKVNDLSFSLDIGGDWALSTATVGSGFQVLGKDVYLEQFKEHIGIEDSGRRGFSGTIDGTGGRFRSVEFPSLSAEYLFSGDFIDVQKLSVQVGSIGELKTDDFRIGFGKQKGGYPYRVTLKDGIFSGFDNKLRSEGISADFVFNDPESGKTDWEGNVTAVKTDIFSGILEGLHIGVSPSPEGIKLSAVSGKLLNGDLKGGIDILTSETPSRMVAGLRLENASAVSGDLGVAFGKVKLDFSGTLPDSSLPEGAGKLEFTNLNLKRQGLDLLYSGSFNTRTSGETLFIEDGFIRNKDQSELKFSGEIEHALNAERRMEITVPDFALTSAVKFLSPFMPGPVNERKLAGSAGFNVEINKLFNAGSTWNGSFTFKDASFAANIGGADLSLKDINGTITLKDEGKTENKLASLVGSELDLNKEVFKNYLQSFKESDADTDSDTDHLRIGGIEYGILKFENVECDLVAGNGQLGITKLVSDFFRGKLYSRGVMNFGEGDSLYNFSFLFHDISLDGISKRLSPIEEYITGRINGLVWLSGQGGELGTIDGPFEFWSVSSAKEPRSIGKALLDKLGAKERLILGSSRSYDNGEISGYIKDGVITFRKFNISNSVLGIKNLSIQADPVKNSISIAHLVSVIREIARRSQTGGPTIETQ